MNPEDLRLQYLYSIALRIEYQGHRSSNFIQLLKNSFEIVMKKDKKGVTNTQGNAEYLFSILLMNYNMLIVKRLQGIFSTKNKYLKWLL